ncbi:MAG: methyltransferase domain-containing protein [Bacteroidota bacterium]
MQPFMKVKDHMITQESFTIQECGSCGFHFTNPRPSIDHIGDYYKSEDYISHSSSNKGLINKLYNRVRNYTLKKKVRLVRSLASGNALLDIGAGTGHFLNACKQDGFSVEGLEPDQDAVRFARTNFSIELKQLDELQRIPEASKDVITMWHVLEHVYYLQQDFKRISEVLKETGVLVIAVPNMESYDAKLYQQFWAAYDVPRHLYHFGKKDIQSLALQHGLELTKVLPMKFDSFYVSMLSEKYKNGSIIRAFWNGWISNLKSSRGGHSSQIYVLKKLNN